MSTATVTAPTAEKKPAKRKVARKPKEPAPPRIPTFVDVPFSEPAQVPLSPADFTNKTHVMLRVIREKENLLAEFESAKAAYKQRIKSKQEEITELEGELQSGTEKRDVALIARFFPGKKLKRILDAGTKKKVRDEPMTPAEVSEQAQPALLSVPVTPPPAPPVPVNQPAPKDGDKPADPDRSNPTNIEDVNVESGHTARALDALTTNDDGKVVLTGEAVVAAGDKPPRRKKQEVFVPREESIDQP